MPADEEDVVGTVGFFNDEHGRIAGVRSHGVRAVGAAFGNDHVFRALVIFRYTIGGDYGGSVSVVGECESGEVGCVAVGLICAVGTGCSGGCYAYAAAA